MESKTNFNFFENYFEPIVELLSHLGVKINISHLKFKEKYNVIDFKKINNLNSSNPKELEVIF